jgi:2-amino-4-hydroxy-6-hydroxymethyldihydropteridine diphosphokinase
MNKIAEQELVFVALGANLAGKLGSPLATLKSVLVDLALLSGAPLLVSPFYQSDPKECPPGSPLYLNAVIQLLPLAGENPLSLLQKLQTIEFNYGRVRTGVYNEARILDLDLLSFGAVQCVSDLLTLPHPRAHERRFVLEPWAQIATAKWQLAGSTLGEWLLRCTDPVLLRMDGDD